MDVEELRTRASEIQWYHSMDLGHGVKTRGISGDTERSLKRLQVPDLRGKRVLDVGTWDGFYSFEAERQGASRVLAVDQDPWGGLGSKAGFDLAREVYGSKIEDKVLDVMDLSPDMVGTFDVVFFLGVLYHLRHPLLALEKIYSVTDGVLILETAVDRLLTAVPVAAFYPRDSLKGDPSNWWGPNIRGVVEMLKAAGFSRVEVIWKRPFLVRLAHWPVTLVRWRRYYGPLTALNRGRAMFHAYR